MNMPGFTAASSLYNVGARYQTTAVARSYGGIVQPAADELYHPWPLVPLRCLKWECAFWDPLESWHCRGWVRRVGVWVGDTCV
jgi:hypothetical protein